MVKAGSHSETLASLLESTIEISRQSGRDDVTKRLAAAKARVEDPRLRVVVVGALKQGKSHLVNSLLNTDICTVGDDEATAVPTVVQFAPEPQAELAVLGARGETTRVSVPFDSIHAITPATPFADGRDVLRLEVGIPNAVLAEGLVFIDTPGVGGHGNPHAASALGLLPAADAVLVLCDASRELTEPELEFLRQAHAVCPVAACVVSKSDLYPQWRDIVAADQRHLAQAKLDLPVIPVSSLLRAHALRFKDEELNAESGFPELFRFLREQVVDKAAANTLAQVAGEVSAAAQHLSLAASTELAALRDPAKRGAALTELERAREHLEGLRKQSALWQQTLTDGITDLAADIDHDLRDRLRRITREAEAAVDETDPGEAWPQLGQWLEEQVATAIGDNFVWAHDRSLWLAEAVAQHFAESGAMSLPQLDLGDLTGLLEPVVGLAEVGADRVGVGQKILIGMRGSYGGVLMFGLITTIMGMALINPISLGAGVLLGTKAYREDREQRIARRRIEAKNAIRQFTDDVVFQLGKESKDRLRIVQRLLRDHFTGIAEQALRSLNESLRAAQDAAAMAANDRETRAREAEQRLRALAQVSERSAALLGGAAGSSTELAGAPR
jgi:hypothetical protein